MLATLCHNVGRFFTNNVGSLRLAPLCLLTCMEINTVHCILSYRKIQNKIKFLKALEKKLSQAYLGSPYYNKAIDFNRAVSFHIPGGTISESTMNPHLYQLAQIESSMDEMNEYLVATTKLTEPGNRHITPALRRWADSDPETKVVRRV